MEIENLTVKDMQDICRSNDSCKQCPFYALGSETHCPVTEFMYELSLYKKNKKLNENT